MMTQFADAVRPVLPPLPIQLLALALLVLAASMAIAPRRAGPTSQAGYTVAHDAGTTPYGSGAALRNLLF